MYFSPLLSYINTFWVFNYSALIYGHFIVIISVIMVLSRLLFVVIKEKGCF